MQQESSTMRALSTEAALAIEKAGPGIVAVHGRRRIPSSGVYWHAGVIVTADHTLQRSEEISVTLAEGPVVSATLAGRDPSTDLAILRIESSGLVVPEMADAASVRPGHFIIAAGRTAEGAARASLAMVGVVGPAWKTWRGGQLDRTVRLDRYLHPNLSGGPAIDDQGRVLGISTSGLSRLAAVVIPASTVERVVAELEKKGRIGRGYLGVGMQSVRIPRKLRDSLKIQNDLGLLIAAVEPESPAEKAGLIIGDVIVALGSDPIRDVGDIQGFLASEYIGKTVKASILRGGTLAEVSITIGERSAS